MIFSSSAAVYGDVAESQLPLTEDTRQLDWNVFYGSACGKCLVIFPAEFHKLQSLK